MSATPLRLRWLWWKHTWHFQAAHKPLCDRFAQDVLRLGSVRVCRSCAALYGSLLVTLLSAPLYHNQLGQGALVGITGALFLVGGASAPPVYRKTSRVTRDVLRSLLGILTGLALLLLSTPVWIGGLLQLIGLLLAWHFYHHQREAHTRAIDPCKGCKERDQSGICSGFTTQAAHLRNYEEAASDWLEQGYLPRR